jgi:hypothetical protein
VSALQFGGLSIAVGLVGVLVHRFGKRWDWIAVPIFAIALALGIEGFILLARSV